MNASNVVFIANEDYIDVYRSIGLEILIASKVFPKCIFEMGHGLSAVSELFNFTKGFCIVRRDLVYGIQSKCLVRLVCLRLDER